MLSIFFTRILSAWYEYCPYYIDEEIKTQEVTKLGFEPRSVTPDTLSCLQAAEAWGTLKGSGSWPWRKEGEV